MRSLLSGAEGKWAGSPGSPRPPRTKAVLELREARGVPGRRTEGLFDVAQERRNLFRIVSFGFRAGGSAVLEAHGPDDDPGAAIGGGHGVERGDLGGEVSEFARGSGLRFRRRGALGGAFAPGLSFRRGRCAGVRSGRPGFNGVIRLRAAISGPALGIVIAASVEGFECRAGSTPGPWFAPGT